MSAVGSFSRDPACFRALARPVLFLTLARPVLVGCVR
jgi:hypothetical protein